MENKDNETAATKDDIIEDAEYAEIPDDEMIPDRLVMAGTVRAWKKQYPDSRLIYFEYFGKPMVLRSYQYSDLETYNALLAKLEQEEIKKAEVDYRAKNAGATDEQIEIAMRAIRLPPRIQNTHFLKMVMLLPVDLDQRLAAGKIDAGLPQTIMDLAHKASGFAVIDADIISEEV